MKKFLNKKNLIVTFSICIIAIALIVMNKTKVFSNKVELQNKKIAEAIAEQNKVKEKENLNAAGTISIQEEESQVSAVSNENNNDNLDTSNWDLSKVNIVYDTNNVAVPVPKGYVASGADGEHTVNTGFVIYEGEEEVTNENCWDESCNRNQWVWVPVQDPSRLYEVTAEGKKIAKSYEYSQTRKNAKSRRQ